MKRHSQILAGTALGLLMASAPLAALPLPEASRTAPVDLRAADAFGGDLILAQAATEETEEERLRREAEEAAGQAEEPAAEEPAAAPEEPAPEEPAVAEEPVEEEAPAAAEEPAAAPESPATAEEPAAAPEAPATAEEPAAAPEAPATAEEPAAAPQAPAAAEQPAAAPAAPATADEPTAAPAAPATADEPTAAPEAPATAEQPAADPAAPATASDPAAPADGESAAGEPAPENAAPLTDSAKEAPAGEAGAAQTAQPAAQDAPPPPESDAAAQARRIEQVESVTAEEGRRIEAGETREERRERRRERRERRQDARVVEELGDRVIIEFNNNVFIESPDYERIIWDSEEVYYEELPRGRVREVIVRADGSRVITIRNRYGDVVRRSRILPDNREIVLVYVEEEYYDDVLEWRDPGANLPPLVLSIPREEYILEAEVVEDPDRYYAFLDQPPVERVERTYSLTEVKRSARIRDKVRRVDLDTINFAFGSAEIEESEINELEGVAAAMERLLEENPGETFLIEGHTDAVGSDLANLALSDARAESVATALTNVFAIPPENLTTQGYGEQYLKVETEKPERENRRVAIRRITPLVAPVASAQ